MPEQAKDEPCLPAETPAAQTGEEQALIENEAQADEDPVDDDLDKLSLDEDDEIFEQAHNEQNAGAADSQTPESANFDEMFGLAKKVEEVAEKPVADPLSVIFGMADPKPSESKAAPWDAKPAVADTVDFFGTLAQSDPMSSILGAPAQPAQAPEEESKKSGTGGGWGDSDDDIDID